MQARKTETPLTTAPVDGAVDVAAPKKKKTWILIPLAVLVVIGAVMLVRYLSYSRTHVSTDNAFLSADITMVSPQVAGTVQQILFKDNQQVRAGQLLAVIDDSTFKVNVLQARANLTAALAAERSAEADLGLSKKTSQGQLTQATGGVQQAASGVTQAEAILANASAAVTAAQATQGSTVALAHSAEAGLQSAIQNRARAVQGVATARAQVTAAHSAVDSANASLKAAQAHATFTKSQVARFQTLANQGAVSREQAESAQQDYETAAAAVESAQDQVATAKATLMEREAELQSAQQGVSIADSAILQARSGVASANHQSQVAAAGVQQAIANRANMAAGIVTAKGKQTQAVGQQQAANTVEQFLDTKQAAAQQAAAKVEQAKAALAQAQLDLDHTRIYAPVDGFVGNRAIDKGAMVQPGLPMFSVVKANSIFVAVNLKETQTANLQPGQEAEIDVDGFPAHSFKGHLTSIAPATGATFALLPPDNASGNFVKVVQRVTVRVEFDPGQPDFDRLRPGMSASVSIRVK
jgi:membrane fusion protein (multidrug efflux system)